LAIARGQRSGRGRRRVIPAVGVALVARLSVVRMRHGGDAYGAPKLAYA